MHEERKEMIKNLITQLPQINRDILHEVFALFSLIILHQSVNRMNETNLSIIFLPAFAIGLDLFSLIIKEIDYFFSGKTITSDNPEFMRLPSVAVLNNSENIQKRYSLPATTPPPEIHTTPPPSDNLYISQTILKNKYSRYSSDEFSTRKLMITPQDGKRTTIPIEIFQSSSSENLLPSRKTLSPSSAPTISIFSSQRSIDTEGMEVSSSISLKHF